MLDICYMLPQASMTSRPLSSRERGKSMNVSNDQGSKSCRLISQLANALPLMDDDSETIKALEILLDSPNPSQALSEAIRDAVEVKMGVDLAGTVRAEQEAAEIARLDAEIEEVSRRCAERMEAEEAVEQFEIQAADAEFLKSLRIHAG